MKKVINDCELYLGDCLEVMPILNTQVDMVLADPPYGTTRCKWDSIIPIKKMWDCLNCLVYKDSAIVITASQPFTSVLICSNLNSYKYNWVWEKPSAKGHLNAKKQPLRAHEDIVVFYSKQPTYNPIMWESNIRKVSYKKKELKSEVYNASTKDTFYDSTLRYPRSVQKFKQDTQKSSLHPTQKPVSLMEYLIKTYTNKGDTVLDFTMGSGTTGVACINTGRKFIGIEKDPKYFKIAYDRIQKAYSLYR